MHLDFLSKLFSKVMRPIALQHGKSIVKQCAEVARSKLANPTLGITDYYVYRLHGNRATRGLDPREYLGWRVEEELAHALNPRSATMPAWDKLTFHLYATSFGIPAPLLVACYRPGDAGFSFTDGILLTSPEALTDWLRTNQIWPLFAKPSYSQQSKGCFLLTGYDSKQDQLLSAKEGGLDVEAFVRETVNARSGPYFRQEMGYLFQKVLRPHPLLAQTTGNQAISCVRVVVAQDSEQPPVVIATLWKLALGDNITDMRVDYASGHLHAPVDIATGTVGPALNDLHPAEITANPLNNAPIAGLQMPHWEEAMSLCRKVALLFPMMRIQHWDLAITDEGPRLLEVNDIGSIGMLQMSGRGLLTPELRGILRRNGNTKRFPWIAKLCH